MSWIGFLQFPDPVRYVIENVVPKLDQSSSAEEWMECLYNLRKYKHYIWNEDLNQKTTIFPSNRWTIVHHAAHFKAPVTILQMVSVDKYPLSLPDAEGKLAVDHLDPLVPKHVKELLEPTYRFVFLRMELKLLQAHFHEVILGRASALVAKYNLILPVLSVMLEDVAKEKELYFNVPEMYGGFTYSLEYDAFKTKVLALWCRSSSELENSEQVFRCTAEGWTLIGESGK